MAAVDEQQKRKEPEAVAEKTAEAAPPAAKRLKATTPVPAVVRKQVEYYLSDENLRYDKFFHEKISADKDGWLELNLVLTCNKMKSMNATKDDVLAALKESKIEVKEGGDAIRRPSNAALPKLETKQQHLKKGSMHAHDGGVVGFIKDVPAEKTWVQVKEVLKAALPENVMLWFVSEVNDKRQCFICTAPFEGDVKFYETLELAVADAKLKVELCMGDMLQQALKLLPKHIKEKREKESRKKQKERNRPIVVGTQRFINVGALRGRVKEILNSRSDGESLKADGSDFKLVKALLEFHPKGADKSVGLVGIKVDKSTQGENRCFFMVKGDGSAEDFSAKKCLDALEANPPYAKVEAPKEEKKADAAAAPAAAPAAAAAPAEAAKADEKKEEKAEEKKEG
eukprot:TRINITY_DN5800_c0_g1_i1.p1 TRINITY_DN5800_c0_g1~~TRINITY_DN5800_c0_g1_i1.p1  ORF type:complete len:424 (-),score=201.45 TRINITY_DN5800_c0_g1_i1:251-1444(-)